VPRASTRSSRSATSSDRRILVIGAGVAGLAAAAVLTRAGRRVTLIEARERLGGRVYSLHLSNVARPIELGAEFVHGHSNALWPLIENAGLPTEPVFERHERIRQGRPRDLPDVGRTLKRLIGPDTVGPDRPLGDVIDEQRGSLGNPEALAATVGFVEGFHAADVHKVGTHWLAENVVAEREDGDDAFFLPGGYDAVPRWLRDQCAPTLLDLRLATPLLALQWTPGSVNALVATSGDTTEEISATQAIVTLPLGVLKTAPDRGGIAIDPMPPVWREALTAVEMGPAHRIVLRFDRAWWNEGGTSISFVHGPGSPFPVWWSFHREDDPRLTGWCGGPRALELAGRPPHQVLEAATASLVAIFGAEARHESERMLGAYHHDWITDPYARGAYSYGGVGAAESRAALAEPVADTLVLAGEALAEAGRTATVHGALMTGRRAGESILERG
jgi:monoamine oxidase